MMQSNVSVKFSSQNFLVKFPSQLSQSNIPVKSTQDSECDQETKHHYHHNITTSQQLHQHNNYIIINNIITFSIFYQEIIPIFYITIAVHFMCQSINRDNWRCLTGLTGLVVGLLFADLTWASMTRLLLL